MYDKRLRRRGQLCGRCLRGVDMGMHDELSIMLNQEEYDDISIAESLISENQRDSEQIQVSAFHSNLMHFQFDFH